MSIVTTGAGMGTPPLEPPAGFQPARSRSLLSYAKYADPVIVFGWVVSTTMTFTFLGPLRYAIAGYFVVGLFVFGRQTMPALARSWPLFLLPILCITSSLWAWWPEFAQRKGVALALTGVVAIYIGTRVSGRNILIAYFAAELIAAALSLRAPTPVNGAWTGFFGQKNFFAIHMFILYACAVAIALDRANVKWLRLVAGAIIPLALFMVLMAKSGTTTLLVIGASAVMFGQVFVWQPIGRIPYGKALLALSITTLVLIVAIIMFVFLQVDVKEEVLGALGKDSSLTGRTMLWDLAERVMQENPWTGLGPDGFWRADRGVANTVTQMLGYDKFVGFSFHNSFYQNGTNYGYPGYWATILVSAWAILNSVINWVRSQSTVNAAFLLFAIMVVIRATSESDLAGEFSGTAVLLFIAGVRRDRPVKQAPLLDPAPQTPGLGRAA